MTESAWFWVGTAGMALGAVALSLVGKRRAQDEEAHTLIHGFVPLVAAIAYFSMAIGQGGRAMSDGRSFWFARYVDWSITTPLLLLGLLVTALHGAHRRPGLVAAVLGADVLMIVTGLFSGLSSQTLPRWTWFLISCGAFVALYVAMFGPVRREALARDHERRVAYSSSLLVLAGLWLLYPVVVLLGPDGTGVWSPVLTTGSLTVIDLLSKLGYGYLAVRASERVADADLARGDVTPAPVTTESAPSGP